MNKVLLSGSAEAKHAASALLAKAGPVLVEVRFPRRGTSPDWYLCEGEENLEPILEKLAPGVVVRLSSVWDPKNVTGEVCLTKST